MGGSIHLLPDHWQQKDLPVGDKKFLVLGSHEPVLPAPPRDWTKH